MKIPPYSYLLTQKNIIEVEKCECFEKIELPCGRFFYFDKNLETSISINEHLGSYVLSAGLSIDLHNDSLEINVISKILLNNLEYGEDSFFDYINTIAGRYVIIFRKDRNSDPYIINDACGMLKITYDQKKKIVSSNIFLIDDFFNNSKRSYRREYKKNRNLWKFGSLGNLQPIKGIKILTPNHQLNLHSFGISRFYPKKELPINIELTHVTEEICNLIEKEIELLKQKYTLVFSLTAGLDSRLSLVFLTQKDHFRDIFFTYYFQDSHNVDVMIASRIAKQLSLNHYILFDSETTPSEWLNIESKLIHCPLDSDLKEVVESWDWYKHGIKIINAYVTKLIPMTKPELIPLHIRSNLFEIGRVFWNKKSECHKAKEILKLSRRDWEVGAKRIFNKYFKETDLIESQTYGYNLLDLFYWEHRCGTWVSEILQGTDFAFNTHSLMNCRKIIELFLSVPFRERVNGTIFQNIIQQKLKEIEDIPINPKIIQN